MLHYVTGFAKSGKTDYAEKLIAQLAGSTVYIGTLPEGAFYIDTIQAHQKRRPNQWELIELIGDPESDFEILINQLPQFQNILFDGLSFYLFRLSIIFDEDYEKLLNLGKKLIEWAVQSDSYVIIVDPPIPKEIAKPIKRVLFDIHLLILQSTSNITFIEKGSAVPITSNQAIKLDCSNSNYINDPRIVHMIKNSES